MGSNQRNRNRRPARRAPWLDPKPRLLVVCEGEVTEPEYLRGFTAACRNPRVHLVVDREHGVPWSLVRVAKERKRAAEEEAVRTGDENRRYDEVWCVFDIDSHPNITDAVQMARDNGILLAISNPCFELWLVLHFRESPGARHRHDVQRMLRDYLPGYDKGVDFADLQAGYEAAVERAAHLDRDADDMAEAGRNPTTGVYRLTESIRAPSE